MFYSQKIDGVTCENSQLSIQENTEYRSKFITVGWPDKFIEHGDVNSLEKKYSLDAESIADKIQRKYNELNLDR